MTYTRSDQQFLRSEVLLDQVRINPPRNRKTLGSCRLAGRSQQRSLWWTDYRSPHQRMGSNQVRLSNCLHDRYGSHDGLYICPLLRCQYRDDFGGKPLGRNSLGDFPSHHDGICIRGGTSRTTRSESVVYSTLTHSS